MFGYRRPGPRTGAAGDTGAMVEMDVQDRLAGIAPAIARRRCRGLDVEAVAVKDLDAVEARLGVPLPAEYRAFMLAFGTGVGPGHNGLIAPRRLPDVNRADCGIDTFGHVRRPFTIVDGHVHRHVRARG
jgi:hypothetical protein